MACVSSSETGYPIQMPACLRDVAERALAYAIENKVEAAYRRSDLTRTT